MAWNIHWQIPFTSIGGDAYTINIYQRDYAGGIVTLEGGENPITTKEDSSNDVFKPIRFQSGYIRVVTDDENLQGLMTPPNSTSHFVRLMQGSAVKWQGFMKPNAYSQPYKEYVWQLEFPIVSVLSAFADTTFDLDKFSGAMPIHNILSMCLNYAYADIDNPLSEIYFITNVTGCRLFTEPEGSPGYNDEDITDHDILGWWEAEADCAGYITEQDVIINSRSVSESKAARVMDVIQEICKTFGVVVREDGDNLVFADYHNSAAGTLRAVRFRASSFLAGYLSSYGISSYSPVQMSTLSSMGDSDDVSIIDGCRSVTISVSEQTNGKQTTVMPSTIFNDEKLWYTGISYNEAYGEESYRKLLFIQLHSTDGLTFPFETFKAFYSDSNGELEETSATVIEKIMDRWQHYYGSFPCLYSEWPFQSNEEHSMLPGVFVRMPFLSYNDPERTCYIFSSQTKIRKSSFVKMALEFKTLGDVFQHTTHGYIYDNTDPDENHTTQIDLFIKWGDLYWNGSGWTSQETLTTLTAHDDVIVANRTIRGQEAYWIEMDQSQTEALLTIEVRGARWGHYNGPDGALWYREANDIIIKKLETSVMLQPAGYFLTSGQENVYQRVMNNGFVEAKNITLKFGSFNSNAPSPSWLQYTYIYTYEGTEDTETITKMLTMLRYAEGTTYYQRPEEHYADIMARYLNIRRQVLLITAEPVSLSWYLYTTGGLYYAGMIGEMNWRDEKEKIKFIEVIEQE